MRKIPAIFFTAMALLATAAVARAADVEIDCAKKHQVIEGFGTCLTFWDGQAHDVYNTEHFKDLYVHDLGCSIIRLDLRPSLSYGEDTDANNLNADKLNWDDAGFKSTVDTAVALYKMNPKEMKVIGSVWSPPAWMKTNNNTKGGGHLRGDRRQAFGKYLAAISTEFEKRFGVPIYAISIQNELSFSEPYESCLYTDQEFHDTIKAVGEAFKKWNVKTKIFGPEDMGSQADRVMGFINAVMNDSATRDDLQIFAVHGYNDDGVSSDEGNSPKAHELRDKLSHFGRELWMTESSGEDQTWLNRHWGALGLGWMIHNSLANGDCSAYVYWQITHGSGAHKEGESLMTGDQPSPKYYAAKHFFKFIRPGARRVDTSPTNKDGLAVSAYQHDANGTLTIVLVNTTDHGFNVKLHIKGSPITGFDLYRSTEQDHCKLAGRATVDGGTVTLDMPANSMITLFGPGAGK